MPPILRGSFEIFLNLLLGISRGAPDPSSRMRADASTGRVLDPAGGSVHTASDLESDNALPDNIQASRSPSAIAFTGHRKPKSAMRWIQGSGGKRNTLRGADIPRRHSELQMTGMDISGRARNRIP